MAGGNAAHSSYKSIDHSVVSPGATVNIGQMQGETLSIPERTEQARLL